MLASLRWNGLIIYCRYQRFCRTSAFSALRWLIGWWIVLMVAINSDLSTQNSRYLVSFLFAIPTFIIEWRYIWGDRQAGRASSLARWWSFWAFSHVPDIGATWLIVHKTGLSFWSAYLIVLPSSLFAFWVKNKFIFIVGKRKTEPA